MSHFEIAEEVIEAAVVAKHPGNSGNWLNVVPKTAWGMSLANFVAWVDLIAASFENRIAPAKLKDGVSFHEYWNKPLSDLQWALTGSVAQ